MAVPRLLRIPLSGLSFLGFYVGAVVIAWILLPLKRRRTRHLSPVEQREAIDHLLMRGYRAFVGFMTGLGLFRWSLVNFEDASLPPPPWVIVANHPTLLDVLFIKGTLPGVTVLVKAALFKDPSVRRLLLANGDFKGPESGDRSFGDSTVLDIFVERLEAGRSVLVFPEGTRSPAWRLHRFRRGAAEAAIRAGVPIIPIFICVDPPILKKGDKWHEMPKLLPLYQLELLPAIDPTGRSSRELTEEIRAEFATRLETASAAAAQRQP